MRVKLISAPAVEPVSLAELRLQLNNDSGSLIDNTTLYNTIPSSTYPIDYELITLDVAPATTWAVGDLITGQTSTKTCIIVTVLTTKTYIVKSRSGAFTLGEIVGVTGTAAKLADQGAANPTFSSTYLSGYMVIGTPIDVLGHNSVFYLNPVNNGTGGLVDAKIRECDTSTGMFTDWTGGGFTTVTEANDTVIQEKAYTGTKQWVQVIAKVTVAACEFGSTCMVWEPVSTEDSMLLEDLQTARLDVENDTGRKIITQTLDYYPQSWPKGDRIKIPYGNLQSILFIKWIDSSGTETNLTKTLTAFAASGTSPATKTQVTSTAHGFDEGDPVYISGTTSYNGAFVASNVTTNTFDITVVFVADDATGQASEDYIVETNGNECGYIVLPYGGVWPNGTLSTSNPIKIRFVCGYGLAANVPTNVKRAIKSRAVNYYMNRGDDNTGYNTTNYDITYDRLINNIGRLHDMDFL